MDIGSREKNASKQKDSASVLINRSRKGPARLVHEIGFPEVELLAPAALYPSASED
jgi:hypothetical protein